MPPSSDSFSLIAFLGAVAIFMFGIRMSRLGVQLLAGDRLRTIVARVTQNRFAALLVGTVVTLILQSSTATTVMLVSFASTGAITLAQAMGVILGADIGTTAVVLLLSLRHVAEYALVLLVSGVALDIFSQRKRTRYISMVFLGFGFVFFGMKLMVAATAPLKSSQLMGDIFEVFAASPIYAFLAATIFTALVQNSATTIGLCMSLAFSGLITLPESVPVVLGANVGTCASSLLNSFGSGPAAKRVAISHLFFKLTGATVAFLLFRDFSALIQWLSRAGGLEGHLGAEIAMTHVIFNLALSFLFLPFLTLGARLITQLVPEPYQPEGQAFGSKYLDPHSLEVPSLAFASAKLELLRMAEIAHTMFRQIVPVFERNDRELLEYVQAEDDKVDLLDRDVKLFLAKLSQESLNPEQARTQLNLVAITTDLEEVCDIINKNILQLADKKIKRGREFSDEGWAEIKDIHTKVSENFQLMISALTTGDETLARKTERHERHLADMEDQYRMAHLQRLHKGMKDTIESSYIHLELLANFRRINSKLTAIVKAGSPRKSA